MLPEFRREVIKTLIDSLYDMLAQVAAKDHVGRVYVVDVRGAMPEELEAEAEFETEVEAPSLNIPRGMKATVDAGSLISFVAGVPEQQKEDILLSTLFAQRVANSKCDRFTEVEAWYNEYTQVLNNIGWVSERFAFSRVDTVSGELRMDKAALAAIAAIATSNQLTMLTEGLKALQALGDDSKQVSIFDFNTSLDISGNFQLGSVEMAGNGAVSLCLGAYYFRCSDQKKKFLFVSFGEEKVNFWTSVQVMVLNTSIYGLLRKEITKRLADSAKKFIHSL